MRWDTLIPKLAKLSKIVSDTLYSPHGYINLVSVEQPYIYAVSSHDDV